MVAFWKRNLQAAQAIFDFKTIEFLQHGNLMQLL